MEEEDSTKVECVGDQVGAGDERKPQVPYVGRIMHGNDRRDTLAQMEEQLREQLGKTRLYAVRTSVLWIARRQSHLESEPCESVRSNPVGSMYSQGRGENEKPDKEVLGSIKVKFKLKDGLCCMIVQTTRLHRDLTHSSEVDDVSRDVFFPQNRM